MSILKLILIISLLAEGAGPAYALRPMATAALKASSAGDVKEVIDTINVNLHSTDATTIGLELLGIIKRSFEGHRILLKATPHTLEEFNAAGELGFVQPVSADRIAAIVVEELKKQAQGRTKKKPWPGAVASTGQSHTITFGSEIVIGENTCNSITLFYPDSASGKRFVNALEQDNFGEINLLIKSSMVIPVGLTMVMHDDRCLERLVELLGGDKAELKMRLISEIDTADKKTKDKKQQEYEKEKRSLDSWFLQINGLLGLQQYQEALSLLGKQPPISLDKWPEAKAKEAKEALQSKKAKVVLAYVDKALSENDPKTAEEAIIKFFSSSPGPKEVKEKLAMVRQAITAKKQKELEAEAEAEDERIAKLLEDGLYNDAYEALKEAATKFRNSKRFLDIKPRLQEIASLAQAEDPYWIPWEQQMSLLKVAAKYNVAYTRYRYIESNRGDYVKAYREAGQLIRGEYLDVVTALPDALFDKIILELRIIMKRGKSQSKGTHGELDVCISLIPQTKEEFRQLIEYVRVGLASKDEREAAESLPDEQQPMHTYFRNKNVRHLIYLLSYAVTETQYDRYFGGTKDRRVSLHPAVRSKGLSKKETVYAKQRQFLINETERVKKTASVDDALPQIRSSIDNLLKSDEPLCPLLGLGGGFFPSLIAIKTFMKLGATPIPTPSQLAKRLDSNKIYSVDVVTIPPSGTAAIRVIMRKEHIFNSAITPVAVLYIFPCDPESPGTLMKPEDVKKCADDWEGTLRHLQSSKWNASNPAFYVGGIDYDWQSEASLQKLISEVVADMPASEQTAYASKLWESHKNFKTRYADEAKLIDEQRRRFIQPEAMELICAANYFFECHYLYGFCQESWDAAKKFIETLNEKEFEDVYAQVAFLRARKGHIFSTALMDDLPASMDRDMYEHYYSIVLYTLHALDGWKDIDGGGREDLSVPWGVISGWDESAPKEETPESRAFYGRRWRDTANLLAEIVSITASHTKVIDRMLYGIGEEGHLDIARENFLFLAPELGYRPFIKDPELVKLIEAPGACSSIEIIKEEDSGLPYILINLNEKDGWEFMTEKIRDFPERNKSRFALVLTDGQNILTGEDFNNRVKDLVADGELVRSDGRIALCTAIETGEARPVIVHVLEDGKKVASALFKGINEPEISKDARKILRDIEDAQSHVFDLDEIVARPYDERITDEAIGRIAGWIESGNLRPAINIIKRTLAMLRVTKGEPLLVQKEKIARIVRKKELISNAETALKRKDLNRIKEALSALEAFLCGEGASVTEDAVCASEDARVYPDIIRIWKALRFNIKRDEDRRQFLDNAQKLLRKGKLTEARSIVEQALTWGGEGADTAELLKRLAIADDDALKEDVIRIMESIDKSIPKTELRPSATKDLLNMQRQTYEIQKTIEVVSSATIQEELLDKLEALRDRLSEAVDRVEKEEEARKERIHKELKALNVQIPVITSRERLTESGRALRRLAREIENIKVKGRQALLDLHAQAGELYAAKQEEINQAVERLRRSVRTDFSAAEEAIEAHNKRLLINTLTENLDKSQAAIDQMPSKKVREELALELTTWKDKVKTALDDIETGDIERMLNELNAKLSGIDEKTAKTETVSGAVGEEAITEKIMGLKNQSAKDRLFAMLDSLIKLRDYKILGIDQEKIIASISDRMESHLSWVKGATPMQIEIWVTSKGVNIITGINEMLDSLNTDYEGSRIYFEKVEGELKRAIETKMKELSRKRFSARAREKQAVEQVPVSDALAEKKAPHMEGTSAKKEHPKRVPSVHAFRERLSGAATDDEIRAIAAGLQNVVTGSGLPSQQLGEYVDLLKTVTDKLKDTPNKSSSAGNEAAAGSENPTGLPDYTLETIKALEKAKGRVVDAAFMLGGISHVAVLGRIRQIQKNAAKLPGQDTKEILTRLEKARNGKRAIKYKMRRPKKLKLPEYTDDTIKALRQAKGNMGRAAEILVDVTSVAISWRLNQIEKIASEMTTRRARLVLKRLKTAREGSMAGKNKNLLKMPGYTLQVISALETAKGNKAAAAAILLINRSALDAKIEQIEKRALIIEDEESKQLLKRLKAALEGEMAGKIPLVLPRDTESTMQALAAAGGSRLKAAETLDISDASLGNRIKAIKEKAADLNDNHTLERLEDALRVTKPVLARPAALPKDAYGMPGHTDQTTEAIKKAKGDLKHAARILGITYSALSKRIGYIRKAAENNNNERSKAAITKLNKALERKQTIGLPKYTKKTIEALEESEGNKTMAGLMLGIELRAVERRIDAIKKAGSSLPKGKPVPLLLRLEAALRDPSRTKCWGSISVPETCSSEVILTKDIPSIIDTAA